MKPQKKYSVDNQNRLLIDSLPVNGRFLVAGNNCIYFKVNETPLFRKQNHLPEKISFRGVYQLNANHDLQLKLNNSILTISSQIIAAENNSIIFEVKSYDKNNSLSIYTLKFCGNWQADRFNRINFVIQNEKNPDKLIFALAWQINKNQQIEYRYSKSWLKRKDKQENLITLEGFWRINDKNRIVYFISGSSSAILDFKASISSPNLYPQDKLIKYQIGVGLRNSRFYRDNLLILFGEWRFYRKAGVSFEIDYGNGNISEIKFGCTFNFNKNNELELGLTNISGRPLGIKLALNHKFLKTNEAVGFLRFNRLNIDSRIEAGIRIPF